MQRVVIVVAELTLSVVLCACASEIVVFAEEEAVAPELDDTPVEPPPPTEETPAPPSVDVCADAIDAFVACADPTAWFERDLQQLSSQFTAGYGPCYGCHESGLGIQLSDEDPVATFTNFPFDRLVTCALNGAGEVVGFEPTRYLESAGDVIGDHPKYSIQPDIQAAYEAFQSDTEECALAE